MIGSREPIIFIMHFDREIQLVVEALRSPNIHRMLLLYPRCHSVSLR